jgi:hypothetical protein
MSTDTLETSRADVVLGWVEMTTHEADYLEAFAYAGGEVDEVFSSDGQIAQKLARASRHYRFPFIAVPITARVNRCKINTIKDAKSDAGTEWISKVWEANDLDVWYPQLFWQTFTYGDAYLMVWPTDEDEDDVRADSEAPADVELLAAGVELNVFDPVNARMIYDPLNPRRKLFFIQRFRIADLSGGEGARLWRADVWYPDRVERWISVKDGDLSRPENWQPYAEDDAAGNEVQGPVEAHDYGEIPFFHHRTGLPYGTPVHQRGYGAQNALTKMLATQLDTSDSSGWRQRYRLLDPDAELDTNQDDTQWLSDSDASAFGPGGLKATGGQETSQRSGPNTVQTYTGTKEVGEFDASDPELFLGPAAFYLKALSSLTETPSYLFFPEETTAGAAPSGVMLQRADAPLNASVARLQTLQKGALREEWLFAGKVGGQKLVDLDIQWEPVERATTLEAWQVIGLKQQSGVPVEVTLEEAGYTPEEAEEWKAAKEAEEEQMRQQMLEAAEVGARTAGAGGPPGKPGAKAGQKPAAGRPGGQR